MPVLKFTFLSQSIELPINPFQGSVVFLLLIIFLISVMFGKHIKSIGKILCQWVKNIFSYRKHDDWTAHCRERKLWPQKQDSLPLKLKGKYLKSLNFAGTVRGRPTYWRAGFVVGNEKLRANEIVDTGNAITIHTGSDYEKTERILPLWKFYNGFGRNNPDFCSVKFDDMSEREFGIIINDKNFMTVKIQGEPVYSEKINPSFRRKVYLKAWVDQHEDCYIKFKHIRYSTKE